MRARRVVGVGVALVAVALGLAFWLWPTDDATSFAEEVEAAAPVAQHSSESSFTASPTPAPEANAADAPREEIVKKRRPLIETFEVTPSRACVGDEVLAEVKLRADAHAAKVAIRGRPGTRGVFSFSEPGLQRFHALADDWLDGMDQREATVRIEACPSKPRVAATWRQLAPGLYRFTARTENVEGALSDVEWTFDDGGPAAAGVSVDRSFALRPQREPQTTVMVTVRAKTTGGASLEAHTALFLVNESNLTRRLGHAFLPVVGPRTATKRGGHWELPVDVRSLFEEPGTFEQARLRVFPCSPGEPQEAVLTAASVLDRSRLGTSGPEHFLVKLPEAVVGLDACVLELRLEGHAAAEPFTAMVGVSVGVPHDAVVVRDAQLLERIAEARKRLGRDDVSVQELEDVTTP